MAITQDEKVQFNNDGWVDGWSHGSDMGEKVAKELDALIYTMPEMSDLDRAKWYAAAYAKAYIQAFKRALTTEFKSFQNFREDTRIDRARKEKQKR